MENSFRGGFFSMVHRAFNGPMLTDLDSQIRRLQGETNEVINLDEIPTFQVEEWPTNIGAQQVLIPRESPFPKGARFHMEPLVDYHIGNLQWERFKWRLLTGGEAGAMIGVPVSIVAGYFHLV